MNFLRKLSPSKHWNIVVILAISFALRCALIFQGGQYYFPDEIKYDYSKYIAAYILQRNFLKAFADLTVTPGQIVYRAIAVIPALAENYFHLTSIVPAIFFSFFSVMSLFLIWKISKRIGISERGSYFVLLFAASSHSLMYYTRHLLPYDLSLFFGLLALFIGLNPNPSDKTYLASGSLVFLCFASYSGYWSLTGFATIFPVIIKNSRKISFFRKSFFTLIGIITPFLVLAIIESIGANLNIFTEYSDFAGTINQGNFFEGWSLPFEYLWHSEHVFLIILIALSLYAALNFARENQMAFILGTGGIVFIYLCLFILSTVLHKFVVYGRLSRQLIPFLVLSSAYGLSLIVNEGRIGKAIAMILLAIVVVQGLLNYRVSFNITFPREFIKEAQEEYPLFKMSIKRTNTGAPFICKFRDYIAMNIKYIHPLPESLPEIEKNVLLSASHPINFFPYQYEGYSPGERKIFRSENIKMKLIRVEDDSQAFAIFGKLKSCVATVP